MNAGLRKSTALLTAVVAAGVLASACKSNASSGSSGGSSPAAANSAAANGSFSVDAANCPADAKTALASGETIKVGDVLALSGPAAVAAGYAQGMKLYFDKVNAESNGVDGHKLQLIAKDDQYDPTKTVPQVTSLLGQDHVFSIVGETGTVNAAAVQPAVEKSCTPQLEVISTSQFSDPAKHPWTTTAFATAAAEAVVWAKYIAQEKPGATVGYVAVDNDAGATYINQFSTAAKTAGLKIVAGEKYALTATNISSQITAVLAAKPDFVIGMVFNSVCAQVPNLLAQGGYTGGLIETTTCGSKAILGPLGDRANNLVYAASFRDPTLPVNADQADVKTFAADASKYGGSGFAVSSFTVVGYRLAKLYVDTLRAASALPGGLTRVNVMNAAWNLNTTLFDSYCGAAKTSGPADPYVDECLAVLQYNATDGPKQLTTFDAEGTTAKLGA
ncbi:ABC transporter substrate-binding protein [Pseudofrankia inefficax]|uniref:Extracellular ligand-binding receptor n=1 Tax=Pseudofrankia inefficax (strain DSM 45817 / CECT 9037 / DDB 130130 / EuI1c) TaxID=298654 RepID=E3IV97_PSEI1|nr:ABC transporter substrate-binding protein [Pseudofrankia inefficax]ADP81261.1 Extracellular ligand-binding receptor [Pseudofrankia inefficax]